MVVVVVSAAVIVAVTVVTHNSNGSVGICMAMAGVVAVVLEGTDVVVRVVTLALGKCHPAKERNMWSSCACV